MSRRAQRRFKFRRAMLWGSAFLVLLWSFGAGYLWRQWRVKSFAAPVVAVQSTEEEQIEALRLLDEGLRARHEERWQGAINALREARRVDPAVRGVDVLIGEIAVEQKDARTLFQAAREALRRGENESSAYLLLALESWMQRGELGTAKAGASAKQHLADAAEQEPSNASVHFFLGELNRLLGESGAAFTNLGRALSRQEPWDSSALLAVKIQLAALEAAEAGTTIWVPLADGQAEAVLALQGALRNADEARTAIDKMLAVMPSLQAAEVLEDASLADAVLHAELDAKLRGAAGWILGQKEGP